MGENDFLWRWEIIYNSLKKPQTSRNYADPTHIKNGFITLYDRVVQLEGLWIEYLKQANLYSEVFGVEIPEELSGRLDMGLPLARKICEILGCDDDRSSA